MANAGPRILIVNDDGIDGPGIQLLERLVRRIASDVWVVAPDEERSGAGHSISVSHPIRVRQRDERHFAVKGTPTDCALLGIYEFCADKRPDILLSGINAGPNLAEDVTYSGTCAAAMEGALLGIPAIALSHVLTYKQPVLWATSEALLPAVIERMLAAPWRPGSFLNINVPNVPAGEVKGVRLTRQGQRSAGTFTPVRRVDERHVPYYWVKIRQQEESYPADTDLAAIRDKFISVTPMQLDMTNAAMSAELKTLLDSSALAAQ